MSNINKYIKQLNSNKSIKGIIKRKILMSISKSISDDINYIENILLLHTDIINSIKGNIKENIKNINKNLENNNINLRNNNDNLKKNNFDIEKLKGDNEILKLRLRMLEKKIDNSNLDNTTVNESNVKSMVSKSEISENKKENTYNNIDYFDFENHFRGPIERIKEVQKIYLPYFKDKKKVLDFGCGRGEFLSLLKDSNINAFGVDIYEPYVEYCKMNGLEAYCGSGFDYLTIKNDIDGIFAGQVIEHLKTEDVVKLCKMAYKILPENGVLIMETPNPMSLAIYTNAFYVDPSHVKPVHPYTLQYFLEKAGFKDVKILYTESSKPGKGIPKLKSKDIENIDEFNGAMQTISNMIFGSQDYAAIAIK